MYPASCEIRIPNYCSVDEENELSNSVMEGADWSTVPYFQTNQVFGRDEMGFFRNIGTSLRYHSGWLEVLRVLFDMFGCCMGFQMRREYPWSCHSGWT